MNTNLDEITLQTILNNTARQWFGDNGNTIHAFYSELVSQASGLQVRKKLADGTIVSRRNEVIASIPIDEAAQKGGTVGRMNRIYLSCAAKVQHDIPFSKRSLVAIAGEKKVHQRDLKHLMSAIERGKGFKGYQLFDDETPLSFVARYAQDNPDDIFLQHFMISGKVLDQQALTEFLSEPSNEIDFLDKQLTQISTQTSLTDSGLHWEFMRQYVLDTFSFYTPFAAQIMYTTPAFMDIDYLSFAEHLNRTNEETTDAETILTPKSVNFLEINLNRYGRVVEDFVDATMVPEIKRSDATYAQVHSLAQKLTGEDRDLKSSFEYVMDNAVRK